MHQNKISCCVHFRLTPPPPPKKKYHRRINLGWGVLFSSMHFLRNRYYLVKVMTDIPLLMLPTFLNILILLFLLCIALFSWQTDIQTDKQMDRHPTPYVTDLFKYSNSIIPSLYCFIFLTDRQTYRQINRWTDILLLMLPTLLNILILLFLLCMALASSPCLKSCRLFHLKQE